MKKSKNKEKKTNNQSVSDANGEVSENVEASALATKITDLDNEIRKFKADNNKPEIVNRSTNELLKLKSQYKQITGCEWQDTTKKCQTEEDNQQQTCQQNNSSSVPCNKHKMNKKKHSRLGIEAKKEESFSEWYSQLITKSELIAYYDVSGCYILRPWSFAIWETIKDYLDRELRRFGVQDCYFPIFVSKSALQKEKMHLTNFAPEVAWVTKSGDTNLDEQVAIRPTSETAIYPVFSKWLQSHRDLPIKLNQWNNAVRWEFKNPQPFIRSREFLWQEGHSVFAEQNEANEEVYRILDLYESVYADLLAVPTVKGHKTEKEKFAGSEFTISVEAFISSSGRGIQGATAHFFGQSFSKLFEIIYNDPETQQKKYVYQNSWGMSTRAIGIMIMIHSDNKGLVLPPPVATYQVVIVPCGMTVNLQHEDKKSLIIACQQIENQLKSANVRVYCDCRDNYTPGWKFNHWELKGVPIRLEIGPKELASSEAILIRRDNGKKVMALRNDIVYKVQSLLQDIHKTLLQNATNDLKSHTLLTTKWPEFKKYLSKKYILLSPFCGNILCEQKIRQDSAKKPGADVKKYWASMGAKSLCIPFQQPRSLKPSEKCIFPECSNKPLAFTLFGRSY